MEQYKTKKELEERLAEIEKKAKGTGYRCLEEDGMEYWNILAELSSIIDDE